MQRLLNAETYEFEDHVLNNNDIMSFDTEEVMSLEDQYRMFCY